MAEALTLESLVERDRDHECEGFGVGKVCVKVVGVADLPTRFGNFRIAAFWNNRDAKEHVAVVHGDVLGREQVRRHRLIHPRRGGLHPTQTCARHRGR